MFWLPCPNFQCDSGTKSLNLNIYGRGISVFFENNTSSRYLASRECSVVECLSCGRGAVGSSLTASLRCVLEQDTLILA